MKRVQNEWIFYFVLNCAVLLMLLFLADKNRKINIKPLEKDSQQSIYLAYFLVTDGFHSMDGISPSNFREPVISVLNAINIARLQPKQNQISKEELIREPELILEMTKLNLVYLIVIYGLVYLLSRKIGLPRLLSSTASFIPVFFFSIFTSYITSVNSELPSAILLLLFSIFIMNFLEKQRSKDLIISGLILGFLALTKAVFLYLFILLIPSLFIFDYFVSKKKLFLRPRLIILFLLSFSLPVGSWMLRNHIQLGTSSISDRGGEVLLIRALKNQMTNEEYRGGFYAYAPDVLQTEIFERFFRFKKEDLWDGGRLQRLNRGLKSDSVALSEERFEDVKSFLRVAQLEHRNLTNYYGSNSEIQNPDEGSKSKALNLIFAYPLNHLKASFLYGWRGIWFYRGRHLIPVAMTLAMYLSLFVLFVRSFWKRDLILFAITILPLLYFLFHAFLTHFIPRYSGLMIPELSIMMVYWVYIFSLRVGSLKSLSAKMK